MIRGPEKVKGKLRLVQEGTDQPVHIIGTVIGLTEGKHGFHIHQHGDTANRCKASGGHFNPFGFDHSGPDSEERHVGDLGNIEVGSNHAASIDIEDDVVSLHGPHSVIGRTIVIHAGEDGKIQIQLVPELVLKGFLSFPDLGQGGDSGSLKTGNAGSRVACGIIQSMKDARKVISAEAVIDNGSGVTGVVKMVQEGAKDWIHIEGSIFGLEPGKHGFHVHAVGSTGNECKDAGGHYNPHMVSNQT